MTKKTSSTKALYVAYQGCQLRLYIRAVESPGGFYNFMSDCRAFVAMEKGYIAVVAKVELCREEKVTVVELHADAVQRTL